MVARLLAPIEGSDAAQVAQCLGLDSAKFRGSTEAVVGAEEELLMASGSVLDDDESFRVGRQGPTIRVESSGRGRGGG